MKLVKHSLTSLAILSLLQVAAQKELPAPANADWYAQSTSYIHNMEYALHAKASDRSMYAVNPANHLAFLINANGYTISNSEKKWSAAFNIASAGREKNVLPSRARLIPGKDATSAIFNFEDMIDIEYCNNTDGLRQNFILHEKPSGTGNLQIRMNVQSALIADNANNNKIVFHTPGNIHDVKLTYEDLNVWDANKNKLEATMKVDAGSNAITISVNDEHAVYPVTIDPLNRNPEWSTSADGILPGLLNNLQLQVQASYGYTVAGLGDINGDGFDDVAVSAPGMADVITGTGSLTGVGAVFIYLGSAGGLSTTPDKILQPNTALDGALFGLSIAAGDITGDGKNDIVIGAPLDRYQTTASGLLGDVNVNVTAGKVYVYRSETLFSSPNPTPFLELRLQGNNFFSTGVAGLLLSNVTTKPLFGYAVSVTKDLNGDNKSDIVIGVPAYLGVNILSAQSGAAFVYYSNNLNTTNPTQLKTPTPTLLGIPLLPLANTTGLLFGYSVDEAGDFNNDGITDLVVGAPAGVDLSSLGGVFTGQFLGGSAYVYYGNGGSVSTTSNVRLQASPSGLLSNTANLFGYDVVGAKNAFGVKTGNILIGAPNGAVLSNVIGGLKVKAGQVHVFKKKTTTGNFTADQVITSPRSSSILSILAGRTINVSLLYGSSIDNMLDVNCDNIGDIIVGEPLSSAVPFIGADVVGGAAYVYLGKPDGTYNTTPIWDLYTQVSPLLGVNATALLGYSVAGAGHVKGFTQGVRSLVGGPANALDFGAGLLNLGNTLGVTFDFAFDNNGLGKSYSFAYSSCNITLPVTLLNFEGHAVDKTVSLNWITATEDQLHHYELQRNTDGVHFDNIAIYFPKNTVHNEYNYPDKHPFRGVNYYRLKMINDDQQVTYSNIVAIRFDDQLPGDVVIAPNPVTTDINIKLTGLEKGSYRAELQNMAGQTIVNRVITVNGFSQTEVIPRTNSMNSGVYLFNLYDLSNRKIKTIRVLFSSN